MDLAGAPQFSKSMMRLRSAESYTDDALSEFVDCINRIRAAYPWSTRTFDHSNLKNVYAVSCRGVVFGFIECTYRKDDLCDPGPISIFLHELHVAASMQKKGVGYAVLEHLLGKGVAIEMVVVNENEKMLSLLRKFNSEHKHISQHTRTVIVRPRTMIP